MYIDMYDTTFLHIKIILANCDIRRFFKNIMHILCCIVYFIYGKLYKTIPVIRRFLTRNPPIVL